MKSKTLFLIVCLIFTGVCVNAADEYIVKFNDMVQTFSDSDEEKYTEATWEEVQEYLDAGIVEYYEPVMYAEMLGSVNWQLENTKATFVQKTGARGDSVKVAVIDGGMNKYEAIADRVLEGYDFHEDTTDVTDENGHGTFVSSMIALEGSAFATESYIVPLKVFYAVTDANGNKGYTAKSGEVAEAIRAAVDDYGCSVINLSLSFYTNPQVVSDAIIHAIDKGAIVVAAAGNDGTDTYHYPAALSYVTGVGSTDENNVVAYFSQRNDSVHVVAPGQSVVVTPKEGQDNVGSGTSYSAPQVSALAAVAKCINPNITNSEFMEIVSDTATDLGDAGYDTSYGHGLINCEAFIKKMIEDRKVYISPVKISNGRVGATVYNNTSDSIDAKGLYVGGDNLLEIRDISLKSGETTAFDYAHTSEKIKFMVWEGLKTLVPLSPVSEN